MKRKIIMVASSKGGIGKSTVALGISLALERRGARVLLVDLDFANPCLDMLCGEEDSILYTVSDVAMKRVSPADSTVAVTETGGVRLLAARTHKAEDTDISDDLSAFYTAIECVADSMDADYTVLDTGAGISRITDEMSAHCDLSLVIASHSPVSLRAAEATAERIASYGHAETKLIINSFDTFNMLKERTRTGLFDMIDSAKIPLAGVVPYDYSIIISGEEPEKEVTSENVTLAFDNIAARIAGKNVPLFSGIVKLRKKKKKLFR